MAGPNSFPIGDKRQWDELGEMVCDKHFTCTMAQFDKNGDVVEHDYITYREWLHRRNRLVTGKTK